MPTGLPADLHGFSSDQGRAAETASVAGHVATRWALDHFLGGVALEDLMAEDFAWQEGWEYRLPSSHAP